VAVGSPSNISRIVNDSAVRADRTRFYAETGGPKWPSDEQAGWLRDDVSVCDWFARTCNPNRTALIGIGTGLTSIHTGTAPLDFGDLTSHLSTLETIWFVRPFSVAMSSLDLSGQANLRQMQLLDTSHSNVRILSPPNPCLLKTLSWATERFALAQDWMEMSFPVVTSLDIEDTTRRRWSPSQRQDDDTDEHPRESSVLDTSQPDAQGRPGHDLLLTT
jgi:hypothetical protein